MSKVKLTREELSEMIHRSVKKVLKEDWYDGFSDTQNDDAQQSYRNKQHGSDYNYQGDDENGLDEENWDGGASEDYENSNGMAINQNSDNGREISVDELMGLSDKAGEVVNDAGWALSELANSYGERIPLSAVEEVLMEYDMTLDDLYTDQDGSDTDEYPEQGDYDVYESRDPKTIKIKLSELREVIKQIIKEDNN